jgi:hypothetical protein
MAISAKPTVPGSVVGTRSPGGDWMWNGSDWVQAGVSGKITDAKGQTTPQRLGAQVGSTAIQAAVNRFRGDTSAAAGQRDAAEVSRRQQIRATEDAQQHRQISNRDARVEGDKDAAARAAAQYQQNMAQMSGAAGGGAAALAASNVQDPSQSYSEHRQRADTQRARSEDLMTQAERAEQNVVAQRTSTELMNEQSALDAMRNTQAAGLSQPETPESAEGLFIVDLGNGQSASFTREEAIAYINAVNEGATESPKEDVPELSPLYADQLKNALGITSDSRTKNIIKAISRRY